MKKFEKIRRMLCIAESKIDLAGLDPAQSDRAFDRAVWELYEKHFVDNWSEDDWRMYAAIEDRVLVKHLTIATIKHTEAFLKMVGKKRGVHENRSLIHTIIK